MAQYVTKIRTDEGDKQIDYNALANLPALESIMSEYHDMTVTVTPGENYSSVTASASLIGNMLRIKINATRKSAANGNFDNESIGSFSIAHGGKITGGFAVTFGNGTSGHMANMITNNVKCDTNALTFGVLLSATAGDTTEFNPFFVMPVLIDLSKF